MNLARIEALAAASRWEDLQVACVQALATEPGNFELHCYLGQACTGLGHHDEALAAADRAIGLEPNEEWPHRLRSIALSNLDRDDAAVMAARECVRLCPERAHTWTLLARRLVNAAPRSRWHHVARKRLLGEAAQAADRACELAPSTGDPHFARALVALAYSNMTLARDACRHGLSVDPESVTGHTLMARIEHVGGNVTAASEHYVTAGRLDPANPNALRGLRSLRARVPLVGVSIVLGVRLAADLGGDSVPLIILAALTAAAGAVWVFVVRQRRFRRQLSPDAQAALAADRASRRWWQRGR